MSGRSEFDGMLRELAQQQSALSQQQTALLRLQTESLRLQRLLIERAMGEAPAEEVAPVTTTFNADRLAPESIVESAHAELAGAPLEDVDVTVAGAAPSEESPLVDATPFGEPPRADVSADKQSSGAAALPVFNVRSRAARYMQAPAPTPIRPVSRQEVDLLARLYETGDAAHLVLNFGQYRGAPLAQVARMDPEYVHQLALTAQRPEVRAAARQMVIALEEIAAHQARPARRTGRRTRSSG